MKILYNIDNDLYCDEIKEIYYNSENEELVVVDLFSDENSLTFSMSESLARSFIFEIYEKGKINLIGF